MKNIPFLLILSRVFFGLAIGVIAWLEIDQYPTWIVALMTIGLLTDVFDGIIARKLEISTEKLRIWDSNIDQFFWLIVIASIFYLNWAFIREEILWIAGILLLEILCYLISLIRFKKPIATHSILSKFWTISLLIFLIDLTLNNASSIPFIICIVLGTISRIEIILIVLKLKEWTTDVPSFLNVADINKGIPIKKNKLFNS